MSISMASCSFPLNEKCSVPKKTSGVAEAPPRLQMNAWDSSSSPKNSSLSLVKKQQFPLAAVAQRAAPAGLPSYHSHLMLLDGSETSGWVSPEALAHRAGEATRGRAANELKERCKAVLDGGSVRGRLDAFLQKLGEGNALTPAQVKDALRQTRTNKEKADAAVSRRHEDVGGNLYRARDALIKADAVGRIDVIEALIKA